MYAVLLRTRRLARHNMLTSVLMQLLDVLADDVEE